MYILKRLWLLFTFLNNKKNGVVKMFNSVKDVSVQNYFAQRNFKQNYVEFSVNVLEETLKDNLEKLNLALSLGDYYASLEKDRYHKDKKINLLIFSNNGVDYSEKVELAVYDSEIRLLLNNLKNRSIKKRYSIPFGMKEEKIKEVVLKMLVELAKEKIK